MSILQAVKDGALALALKSYLNDRFKDYGEITDCTLDTGNNRLRVTAQMRGEQQLVTASIDRYELAREGEEAYVVLHKFSASREWLARLLTALLTGKRYKMPAAVTRLI